jgi:hypothetical protein
MLGYIDPIIFPDECEVLEVAPGRYVYNIFKNGSSSLRKSGFRQLSLDEVATLNTVEVFIREPYERYVSGVQTYLSQLDIAQDRATVLSMIDQFLFLNRHFALQFHWLVNLARHTSASITLRPLSDMGLTTELTWNTIARDEQLIKHFQDNDRLWFYLKLDKILIDTFIGQTVKFKDIVAHIHAFYPVLYEEVIQRSQELCTVLD